MTYPYGGDQVNPIKAGGIDTPQMYGAILIGALVFLILIRRGFRGMSVGGVGVSVS